MAECTFQPALTARGRRTKGKTPQELSEGDRLLRDYHKVSHGKSSSQS